MPKMKTRSAAKKRFKKVGGKYFFNFDETFWRIINAALSMFGHTGSESTILNYNGNEKQGFTTLLCISAIGYYFKPIIIKKGLTDRCLNSLVVPDSIKKYYSSSGWINDKIMLILLNDIKLYAGDNDSVLLLDQYSVHTTDIVKEEAAKNNIQLIFIPSNMTYKYQPLDVGINGPLKSSARKLWKKEVLFSDPLKYKPSINDGVKHLASAINTVMTEENIISSFKKALPFLWDDKNC